MDNTGDHPPDAEIGFFGDLDRRVMGVCRNQLTGGMALHEPFHCQLSIHDSDDNFSARCFQGSVNNQDIPMVYPCILHGITRNPHKKGGNRMLDQQLIQIELSVNMVVGG